MEHDWQRGRQPGTPTPNVTSTLRSPHSQPDRWVRAAQATLEGFDFAASPKLPAAQIRDLTALRWLAAGQSVIFYGPVGSGTSRLGIGWR